MVPRSSTKDSIVRTYLDVFSTTQTSKQHYYPILLLLHFTLSTSALITLQPLKSFFATCKQSMQTVKFLFRKHFQKLVCLLKTASFLFPFYSTFFYFFYPSFLPSSIPFLFCAILYLPCVPSFLLSSHSLPFFKVLLNFHFILRSSHVLIYSSYHSISFLLLQFFVSMAGRAGTSIENTLMGSAAAAGHTTHLQLHHHHL